ncbi:UTP-glucose-1-phosphate uridylyltransferase [Sporosarcina newyorkensis 2681]|uniref:UTP--glucose-1-phosphate uridylyltransferase n=1 Tax=Sporosarcina newyorkensis 2681 TaxID=1027292 RepID=F9DXV3_9BACL|nr:UTP--glucose-1-phosphate uridylyltransferase GalU [Sporosarcina newyorkensis]EGQ20091.1 UTP-glucose-1-phosphate uridylyltransferase [Sporosarcina newyorkensis 2681]
MKITKAIIPAAGFGTRFLPATKAQPKEMLPIIDKPTIQYIVEEAVASGITDIIIVTGKGKRSIEDHFDYAPELEANLFKKGRADLLNKVRYSSNLANIHYVRQKEPLGLGHAIWCARSFIGNEPFAVLLGDDIVQSETPCLGQLINVYEKTGSPIVGVQQVPQEDTERYGIIDPGLQQDRRYEVRSLIEKPSPEISPSNLAIVGRYILTPDIFNFLSEQEIGFGGEIQLTDAIQKLNHIRKLYAYEFEGKRYDVGEKAGFVKATLDFALLDEDIRFELINYMKDVITAETAIP